MEKFALITGASSGIGEEFAKQLAAKGKDLILVARSEKKLQELATQLKKRYPININIFVQDLSERGAAEKVFNYCVTHNYAVDFLINNAGIGLIEEFREHKLEPLREMLLLNVVALTELCHYFLPHLEKHQGILLNVASQAGFQPQAYMASYAATKAYVLHFTEALRVENEKRTIQICALCPGPTKTAFFARAGTSPDAIRFKFRTPQEVVETALDGIEKNKAIIIPGTENRFMALLHRLYPRSIMAKSTKYMVNR